MDPTYRSQYLIDALRSMGQQPQQPQTPAALGGDHGARALQQFAQDRYYRQQAQTPGLTDMVRTAGIMPRTLPHDPALGMPPQGYGQPQGGLPQAPAPPGAPPGPTALGGLPGVAAQMMQGQPQPPAMAQGGLPQGMMGAAQAQQGAQGGFGNWQDVLRSMAGAIGGQRYGG